MCFLTGVAADLFRLIVYGYILAMRSGYNVIDTLFSGFPYTLQGIIEQSFCKRG